MPATRFEPGCIIDSHHGHYVHPQVIELAWKEGFNLDPFEEFALNRYDEEYHAEDYPDLISQGGLLDRAVDWLNENRGVPNHTFDFNEGDFGLYPDDFEEPYMGYTPGEDDPPEKGAWSGERYMA